MEANLSLSQNSVDASTTITPRQIYRSDPLMVLLRDKLRLTNLWIFSLLLFITLGCFYALYALPDVTAKLVNQTIFAVFETATACLFYSAYIWLPDGVSFLFNSLKGNGVLDTSTPSLFLTSYENFCKSFLSWMDRTLWPVGTLIFVILYLLNRYLMGGPPFIKDVPTWLQFVTAAFDGLIAYCVFMSVFRFVISIIFVNRLFRSFTIHVYPLHPDGCGGLGVMRRVLWITVAIILGTTLTFIETIQISAANHIPSSTLDIAMLTVAYLVLAPSLLMGWLALPHYLMLKARQSVLLPLVLEFQQVASRSFSASEETSTIVANTDRLSAIKKYYDLLFEIFPTWPVEFTQVRNIIAALSLPALIPLFPPIADVFKFVVGLLPK